MNPLRRKPLVAAILAALPLSALAQAGSDTAPPAERGTLDTVVITATKRPQIMQDVPQTISVFSEKNIKDTGAKDFAGLVNSMAGVELRQEQGGQGGVAVRGISELNMMNLYGGTGSATGMYLDEMPLSSAGRFPALGAFDMQRVEVLKGPQGTLFGEGSLAGTVRFIANKPRFNKAAAAFEGSAAKTEDGARSDATNLMVNLPLGENAGMRVVAYNRNDGGYMDARITDGKQVYRTIKDANGERSTGGRLLLRAEPSSDLTLSAMLVSNDSRNGVRSRGASVDTGSFSTPESQRDKLTSWNLTAEYSAGLADVVASVSRMERKITADTDQSQSIDTIGGALEQLAPLARMLGVAWVPNLTAVHSIHNYDATADTLELRLVSNKESRLKWTVGLFHKKTDTLHAADADSIPAVPAASWQAITSALSDGQLAIGKAQRVVSTSAIKQNAVFGEVSHDLTGQWQLLLGGRYFKETRSSLATWDSAFAVLSGGLPPGSSTTKASSSLFNPKLTASYKWTPDMLAYATYSNGFRSGGQNEFLLFTPTAAPDFRPETLTNQELGLKTTLFNNTVMFNVSAYSMKWKDLQQIVQQGIGGVGKAIGNVGSAHSNGADLDVKWMPTRQLQIDFALSLLKATLDNDVVLAPSAGGVTVPEGTAIPGTTRHTFSLGGSYRLPLGPGLTGFAGGRVSQRGHFISDLRHYQDRSNGSTTVDLRAGVEAKNWQLYAFMDNATNQQVAVRQDFDGPDLYSGKQNYFWARPRTIGLNLRVGL
jgi:iron complex outermembrane receptor protein